MADQAALLAAVQASAAGSAGQAAPQAAATPFADATSDLAVLASRYSAGAAQGAQSAESARSAGRAVLDKEASQSAALYASRADTARTEVGAAQSRAAATRASAGADLETARIRGQLRLMDMQEQAAQQEAANRTAAFSMRDAQFVSDRILKYGPKFENAFGQLAKRAAALGIPASRLVDEVDDLVKNDPNLAGVDPATLKDELRRHEAYVWDDQDGALRAPVYARAGDRPGLAQAAARAGGAAPQRTGSSFKPLGIF